MAAETAEERHVWDLLTRDFYWQVPPDYPVGVFGSDGAPSDPVRLQVFEVAVPRILSHLRPEFSWQVTANRRDDGLDFIGIHKFLDDIDLGIAAAITVGGQCKKRTRVSDIAGEVAGSLVRMGDTFKPTFFVVALSARLARARVDAAQQQLERQFQRHCHILDRDQIEGLVGDHLDALVDILRHALTSSEIDDVVRYFRSRRRLGRRSSIEVSAPARVLAGVPFRVDVELRSTLLGNPAARLWWLPRHASGQTGSSVILLGPIGADVPSGARVDSSHPSADPFHARVSVELVTYSVGRVDLGDIVVGLSHGAERDNGEQVGLGTADVVENSRPRFYDRPFQSVLRRLSELFDQAQAAGVAAVGIVGAGGSGKTRVCEEFGLDRKRGGGHVVTARQTKTHDAPHRIIADLLLGLAGDGDQFRDPAEHVLQLVSSYDPALAVTADAAIRSVFGARMRASQPPIEQTTLSVLVLLIVARLRAAPVVLHLQELHWCGTDTLLFLERLLWQVSNVLAPGVPRAQRPDNGVLFLLEGRVRENYDDDGGDSWTSVAFEEFLRRLDCPTLRCGAFTADDGRAFVDRLFEESYNRDRLISDDLLVLQRELAYRIFRTAGGNPFHSLEQVRVLRDRGVIGQNPVTGLLYMIRPDPHKTVLPNSIFDSIRLRWRYLQQRRPSLALLIWGCSLIEDQLPIGLFHRLWTDLAPDISLRDVDASDMLWTGDGEEPVVRFHHEHYFESLRRFVVPDADRVRVAGSYIKWFAALRQPTPADRFRWARALLAMPNADMNAANKMLVSAQRAARAQGDVVLTRRLSAFYLDRMWEADRSNSLPSAKLVHFCDQELDLCRELLSSDRDKAEQRLLRVRGLLRTRLNAQRGSRRDVASSIGRRHLLAETLWTQLLFNDRRAAEGARIAERVVLLVRGERRNSQPRARPAWESLEMEALYSLSCAQALSGDLAEALSTSEHAARIAMDSSSPLARKVISTYANILLVRDPPLAEALLRDCIERGPDDGSSDASLVEVHLSMALVLQAYRSEESDLAKKRELLEEARDRLTRVFGACFRLGLYPDAGAAALMRGVVSALDGEGDEVAWFAQAVAAAARGRQMETLWRAHTNLASALYRKDRRVTQSVRDHALAALEVMQDTLSAYAEPDQSPRFELLRVPLADAIRFLTAAGDEAGAAALRRFPRLRDDRYAADHSLQEHYRWLRIDGVNYVLY